MTMEAKLAGVIHYVHKKRSMETKFIAHPFAERG